MMKDKKKLILSLCLCAIVFLLGIGIMLYPMLSAHYADSTRSEIRTQYQEVLETVGTAKVDSARQAAEDFNRQLFTGEINHLDPVNNGYYEQLNLAGNGIMAYVIIPKLNLTLPVYHGTGDDVLQHGAGHMPQSSLPVGGRNTHTVITAHSGMASNPMFSDLELMEEGDFFQIEVLNEILTYKVFQIEVVLPQQIDSIQLQRDEDLATLVTCTPIGVNTHRLLVQGTRVPTPEAEETVPIETNNFEEHPESVWMDQYYKSILLGISLSCMLIIVFASVFGIRHVARKRKRADHEN